MNEGIHFVKPSVAFNDPVAVISNKIETINKMRQFKDVPKTEDMPFLDNMRFVEKVEKNDLNSTSEFEEIKASELPLDNRTEGKSLD